jgi:peptidoglycan/xylan/chitin deacetylase (PgdA/CDA1 family)
MNLITIPYYHCVSNEKLPHIYRLYKYKNIHNFNIDIEYFAKNFSIISLKQLISRINYGIKLPDNSLLITFDDGFKQIFDIIAKSLILEKLNKSKNNIKRCVQILSQLHLPVSSNKFFNFLKQSRYLHKYKFAVRYNINNIILSLTWQQASLLDEIANQLEIDFEEYLLEHKPYLTTSQIQSLVSDGFEIGSHGTDHIPYQQMNLSEKVEKTKKSFEILDNLFNIKYRAFAFPYTDYGISYEFFELLYNKIKADISFGTAGLIKDSIKYHFQRIWMENTRNSAYSVIYLQRAKLSAKKLFGKGIIKR